MSNAVEEQVDSLAVLSCVSLSLVASNRRRCSSLRAIFHPLPDIRSVLDDLRVTLQISDDEVFSLSLYLSSLVTFSPSEEAAEFFALFSPFAKRVLLSRDGERDGYAQLHILQTLSNMMLCEPLREMLCGDGEMVRSIVSILKRTDIYEVEHESMRLLDKLCGCGESRSEERKRERQRQRERQRETERERERERERESVCVCVCVSEME
jgi:hypothetical protein